jgi:hypothetical protein
MGALDGEGVEAVVQVDPVDGDLGALGGNVDLPLAVIVINIFT